MLTTTFDPALPHRFARYARMSSDLQNPRSPDQQFENIAATLGRCGYPWTHVRDFRDDGISGRLMRKRTQFMQMLQEIRTGELAVDLILVDTLERFGRMEQVAALRRELETQYGVLVLTADTHFADPTSLSGQALVFLESYRATSDGHVKAHNVLRGKIDTARQKHWPGGPAPLGYKLQSVMKAGVEPAEVDHRILVPDPATAPVAQRIFELARQKGFGAHRIAREFNGDARYIARFGTVSAAKLGYVLGNPIYRGTLRLLRVRTGIVQDRRASIRNAPEDVMHVPGFCEPLVTQETWDAVQAVRQQRSRAIRAAREQTGKRDGKQIRPIAPGVVLKYPLTGLVRCAVCGAALRPSTSGGARYFYYVCPRSNEGRCANTYNVRGDWLWKTFVAHLRERVFPLPDASAAAAPEWLAELAEEVRAQLRHCGVERQSRRPALEGESADLDRQIAGWSQSLAKPDLSAAVRSHIEADFAAAITRKQQVEAELAQLGHELEQADKVCDLQAAVECLRRLDETLARGNPTELNLELTHHVDQIVVAPDGAVTICTNRLGVFEGAREQLVHGSGVSQTSTPSGTSDSLVRQPRRTLLARRAVAPDVAEHLTPRRCKRRLKIAAPGGLPAVG